MKVKHQDIETNLQFEVNLCRAIERSSSRIDPVQLLISHIIQS